MQCGLENQICKGMETTCSSLVGEGGDVAAKILVAEDNPSNYKLIEVILRRDYTLFHASDGREAVEMFAQCRPDLVLMDISMPVMDGYEAFRRIRQMDTRVPVVAVTAFAFETDRLRMVEAGFDGCLAKPLRIDELKRTVAEMLSRKN